MIIEIETRDAAPIYEQLRDQIVFGAASGKLVPGEALPSVRRLAADLGINFHTVNKAYATLNEEGYISMDRRKGAVVAGAAKADENFLSGLVRRISLSAAEAICRGVGRDEFIELCAKCHDNCSAEKKEASR